MSRFYAYVKIQSFEQRFLFENVINNTFSSSYLEWINDTNGKLTVEDEESFNLKLEKMHYLIFSDFNLISSILIVPYFNPIFRSYLKKMNTEVCTAFDIFFRHSSLKETKNDAYKILNSISEDNLNTIKAYIKCNGNANEAAEELFLHKNSFAYRIKKFTNDTLLDYNDLNTLLFIKLIITLCK